MSPEPLSSIDDPGWLQLRAELWPDCDAAEHLEEMAAFLGQPERFAQFIVRGSDRTALGLAEASIRQDYVNGTSGSPVAFLEGLYVVPSARGTGIARRLVLAVEEWALSRGCSELASDTQLENTTSQAVHRRLGFAETERVVYFNMPLGRRRNAA
ncbi:GNAT family N-acetyltransferase [Salmonella enterica]|nr:GNAT family N-acetyltransferase [Salmonella enterica]EIS8370613.1 GNAT family N-acetyltransferase [Salmonella enterica]